MLTEVTINSVDVTSYLVSYDVEITYGDETGSVSIKLVKNVNDVLSVDAGQTIVIKRGISVATETTIFSGYIEKYELDGGIIKISGQDKSWILIRTEATQLYDINTSPEAGIISEIFTDLVTTYGGLNADSSSVQNSGTVKVLNQFICDHSIIFERCKTLAEAIDWQFYYDSITDKMYFEPEGYVTNTNNLIVGNNVLGLPRWILEDTDMVNDLTIIGASQEIETTESGRIGTTSGYTTTSVNLSYSPVSVKVYLDASNPPTTLKIGGMVDSTSTYDYYVDSENKKIISKSGTTFTTNHYMEIRYSHLLPIPVHMYDSASKTLYGTFTETITYNDITSINDAEIRGADYLSKYSKPFIKSSLKVLQSLELGYKVGQLVRVIDEINTPNIDNVLVINRINLLYPEAYDLLSVGDKNWKLAEWQADIEQKIKLLNDKELKNIDIITEIVNLETYEENSIKLRNRYLQITGDVVSDGSDTFLLSHPDYGILGTNVLGDTGITFGSTGNYFTQQYNNEYKETFIDTDFKDSTNTTATWTGNGSVNFTTGQIAQSSWIDKNNGSITSVLLVADNSTNLSFEMTADGTNWESVTSGTVHTFSDSGNDLRWRATASDTATLSSITITEYH